MNPNDYSYPPKNITTPALPSDQDIAADAAKDAAADLIRQKLDSLYGIEPPAAAEQQQAETITFRSKHQAYMHQLTQSGRSMEDIQAAWHSYYASLPDNEKHEVWQEFYSTNATPSPLQPAQQQATITNHNQTEAYAQNYSQTSVTPAQATPSYAATPYTQPQGPSMWPTTPPPEAAQDPEQIRADILQQVESRARRKKKGGILHSMAFGLGIGALTMLLLLFGFFNERFIAPFMTPSRSVSSTPLIIDPESATVGSEPKLIIPKINVEIPVVYDEPSIQEDAVQKALERGVVHYATTPNPGELGNGAIFGHSANNILNSGKYKFAFVLLHRLESGDTFYLEKDGIRYVYKVYEKKIVPPTEVSVLRTQAKPATFALITCDPPGTSLKRLVVYGEQISPDPINNTASTASTDTVDSLPATLPSDPPSLWSRITDWFSN